jgi:DNA-binding NarL/FixJ family response regulator
MIRVFIADDHRMVREGFTRIIERHSDMEVAGEAASVEELFRRLDGREGGEGDVLILDISMPGPGFLPTMDRLASEHRDLPVLVVSMHPEEDWAVRALEAGAAGYLSKKHGGEELAEAVRRLHAGSRYVSRDLADTLARRLGPEGAGPPHEALSRREYEVLCLLGSGRMVKSAALELGISPKTVSTYRARILEKMGLGNTADLIRYVVEHDLTF